MGLVNILCMTSILNSYWYKAIGLGLILLFSTCKKDPEATHMQGNEFVVSMTDGPGNYTSLTVEILKVEAYNQDYGWIELSTEPQFINVLELTNGAEIELAKRSNIATGKYTQLKIIFGTHNTLSYETTINVGSTVMNETISVDLEMPSKEVSLSTAYEVTINNSNQILLDFNVAQSIIQSGNNFILTPSLKIMEDKKTGIQGTIQGGSNAAILVAKEEQQDTFSTYMDANGNFLLRGIKGGIYNMVIKSYSDTSVDRNEYSINGIVVTQGKITQMGVITVQ